MKKALLFILALTAFGYSAKAQETIVTIGTGSVIANVPARSSFESYGQTIYYPAQLGMAGYITKLAYKRNDTQSYANAMHWAVYTRTK